MSVCIRTNMIATKCVVFSSFLFIWIMTRK